LTSAYDVDLGYEQDTWTLTDANPLVTGLTASGKPTQSYVNIGVGHSLSENASFKLLYQIARYQDKGTSFDGTFGDSAGDVATGQFSVKF